MTRVLALHWWALALRGIVAIIFGLIAFFMPAVPLYGLTILFGAYALIDGTLSLIVAVRSARRGDHWWALLFEGVTGVAAAIVTAVRPLITLVVLIFIIAAWAIVTGILEIAAAIRLRRFIPDEWLLILTGVASIVFGILLFATPGPGAIELAWWMGAWIFVFGVLMLTASFRLRRSPGALRPQPV